MGCPCTFQERIETCGQIPFVTPNIAYVHPRSIHIDIPNLAQSIHQVLPVQVRTTGLVMRPLEGHISSFRLTGSPQLTTGRNPHLIVASQAGSALADGVEETFSRLEPQQIPQMATNFGGRSIP